MGFSEHQWELFRRRWPGFVLGVIVLMAAVAVYVVLTASHQKAVRALLERNLLTFSISWSAVQTLQRNSVVTYFEEYIQHPRTLELLRMAQDPAQQDLARLQLFRHLSPAYERMVERGVRQFHFHMPNGDSLLRFHHPARFGDNLSGIRESIRRANAEKVPVFGFEVGRVVSGYRSVFPVIDSDGWHLGSVELSMPFRVILAELQTLLPQTSFQLLLHHQRQRDILFAEQHSLYEPWAGSAEFLLEDPHGLRPDSPPPLPDAVAELVQQIGKQPELQKYFLKDSAQAFRLRSGGQDYAVLQLPLLDPGQVQVGIVVAYTEEPELTVLDRNYWVSLIGTWLALLALAVAIFLFLRALDEKLSESNRLQVIARTMGQGLYVTDADGRIVSINPYARELMGYTETETLGANAHELLHRHSLNDYQVANDCPIVNALRQGNEYRDETVFRRADGEFVDVSLVSRPLLHKGHFAGAVTVFEDIRVRKQAELQLQHKATRDNLTGLANRLLLADRLQQAMARAQRLNSHLAVVFVDLDHFKPVNDAHGHDVGDQLLIAVANRMQQALRAMDTLARLGGDEFVAVLVDLKEPDDALALVQRLLNAVEAPVEIDTLRLQVSASVGLAFYPQANEADAEQLLRQSDQAMYRAKALGRNAYQVYSD